MSDEKKTFEPISVKEMYSQDKPSDFVTWNVCRYLGRLGAPGFGRRKVNCECCPSSRPDDHVPEEEVIDGCRAISEELARYVIAALVKEGWTPPQSN